MNRDDIRGLKHVVQRHERRVGLGRPLGRQCRPPGNDFHAESPADGSDFGADLS